MSGPAAYAGRTVTALRCLCIPPAPGNGDESVQSCRRGVPVAPVAHNDVGPAASQVEGGSGPDTPAAAGDDGERSGRRQRGSSCCMLLRRRSGRNRIVTRGRGTGPPEGAS